MSDAGDDGAGAAPAGDAFAPRIALDPAVAASAEARDYLRAQAELARLQSRNLIEQNGFELSHLRFRRFGDFARFALEAAAAVLALIVLVALGVALWSAAHENGLVIEAFSVPPDLAARGITGQAVASQLLDKLAVLQDATDSARPANSYANNWGGDIKVQIPETGISIGDFYRMLVRVLGRQTTISGEVYRAGTGLAITAHTSGQGGATVTGSDTDLDGLLQRSAEAIYQRTQPYRYAIYANAHGKPALASRILTTLTEQGGTAEERGWAYTGLGVRLTQDGDFATAIADERKALALLPRSVVALSNIDAFEAAVGHEQAAIDAARRAIAIVAAGDAGGTTARALAITLPSEKANLALYRDDPQELLAEAAAMEALPDYSGLIETAREMHLTGAALMHDPQGVRAAYAALPPPGDAFAGPSRWDALYTSYFLLGDAPRLLALYARLDGHLGDIARAQGVPTRDFAATVQRQFAPMAAYGFALAGDAARARRLIDATPLDCDLCLRVRGAVAALAHDGRAADAWFARAAVQAPDVPMTYVWWGRALLARGDAAGAIAKAQAGNTRSPHFADPLALWGEALMAENRSDLALPKFAEAARYAPRWAGLHAKWAEALWWSGDKPGARREFGVAARLDPAALQRAAPFR